MPAWTGERETNQAAGAVGAEGAAPAHPLRFGGSWRGVQPTRPYPQETWRLRMRWLGDQGGIVRII